jgi:transcriptional regulator with XRE-family HTH domain
MKEGCIVQLSQPEIIQLLRKRAQMNQGDFGAKAFKTSFESGRTKIKNIELGKQTPTGKDLENMARVLGIDPSDLAPSHKGPNKKNGIFLSRKTLDRFDGLEAYVDMLNKAVSLEDDVLIHHIAGKIADIFSGAKRADAASA